MMQVDHHTDKTLSKEDIQVIRKLHREGLSIEEIAERFHVERWAVKMILQLMD